MKSLDLLTVKETSEYLRIPAPTVYHLIHKGQLPAIQIGKRWRIKREQVDRDVLKRGKFAPGGARVLIVDPEPDAGAHLGGLFEQEGLTTDLAYSASEALLRASQRHYDLVMMDLKLPDESGDVAFRKLTTELPDTRIVILSKTVDEEALANILQDYPATVMLKPVAITDIRPITRQLNRNRWGSRNGPIPALRN